MQDHARAAPIADAGFVLVLGIGSGVGALILFAGPADDVLDRETLALETAVFDWLSQFRSAPTDTLMGGLSLLGAEWLAAVSVTLVFAGAELLDTLSSPCFNDRGLFLAVASYPFSNFLSPQDAQWWRHRCISLSRTLRGID